MFKVDVWGLLCLFVVVVVVGVVVVVVVGGDLFSDVSG